MKRTILAVVVVFIVWLAVGFVVQKTGRAVEFRQDTVVRKTQRAPSSAAVSEEIGRRWRREATWKAYIKPLSMLVCSIVFVTIYSDSFLHKGIRTAIPYGIMFGLAMGLFALHDMCAATPVPLTIPLVWCAGALIQGLLGGFVLAWIVKKGIPSDCC